MKNHIITTNKRCPNCCSNDFGVLQVSTSREYYRVHDGGVEIIPYLGNRITRKYKFTCKECGHEWEGEEFATKVN